MCFIDSSMNSVSSKVQHLFAFFCDMETISNNAHALSNSFQHFPFDSFLNSLFALQQNYRRVQFAFTLDSDSGGVSPGIPQTRPGL